MDAQPTTSNRGGSKRRQEKIKKQKYLTPRERRTRKAEVKQTKKKKR